VLHAPIILRAHHVLKALKTLLYCINYIIDEPYRHGVIQNGFLGFSVEIVVCHYIKEIKTEDPDN
jgi:hypothetical protein